MTWQALWTSTARTKPDVRFGFEIKDISDIAKDCSFKIVQGHREGTASSARKRLRGQVPAQEIDKLGELSRPTAQRASRGLAADGSMTSSLRFLSEDEIAAIKERAGAKENDLLFVVARTQTGEPLPSLWARCAL